MTGTDPTLFLISLCGRFSGALRSFNGLSILSRHLYFDGLCLRFFGLGQVNFQHPVLRLGGHLVPIRAFRQSEATKEAPVRPFDTVILLILFFLFEPTLPRWSEHCFRR